MDMKKIDELKAAGHLVRKIKICGAEFIYRSMSRTEWVGVQQELEALPEKQRLDKNFGEEFICKKFLVDGADKLGVAAGVPTQLSELILQLSGFGQLEEEPEEL